MVLFFCFFYQNQLTQSTNALESAEELLEFAQHALDIKDEDEFTKVCIYQTPHSLPYLNRDTGANAGLKIPECNAAILCSDG